MPHTRKYSLLSCGYAMLSLLPLLLVVMPLYSIKHQQRLVHPTYLEAIAAAGESALLPLLLLLLPFVSICPVPPNALVCTAWFHPP